MKTRRRGVGGWGCVRLAVSDTMGHSDRFRQLKGIKEDIQQQTYTQTAVREEK